MRECLEAMRPSLPRSDTDIDALATYVLVVMEGGVMLSRLVPLRGAVRPAAAVAQLRGAFLWLLVNKGSSSGPGRSPRANLRGKEKSAR